MAFIVTSTPTITAGAYSANDAVGGKMTVIGAPMRHGDSVLQQIRVIDKGNQGATLRVVLFNQDFTATSDNAAFAFTGSEDEYVIAVVEISTYTTVDSIKYGESSILSLPIHMDSPLDSDNKAILYAQALTTGTPTYTATDDLIFQFCMLPSY